MVTLSNVYHSLPPVNDEINLKTVFWGSCFEGVNHVTMLMLCKNCHEFSYIAFNQIKTPDNSSITETGR